MFLYSPLLSAVCVEHTVIINGEHFSVPSGYPASGVLLQHFRGLRNQTAPPPLNVPPLAPTYWWSPRRLSRSLPMARGMLGVATQYTPTYRLCVPPERRCYLPWPVRSCRLYQGICCRSTCSDVGVR
jgi:hypothetical protein